MDGSGGSNNTDHAIYDDSNGVPMQVGGGERFRIGGSTVRGWGDSMDKAVPGDYDRDGKTDIAVFRPSDGNWFILLSSTNTHVQPNLGSGSGLPTPSTYIP